MLVEPQAWPGVPLNSHLKAVARALKMLVWREWLWRARSSSVPEWSLTLAGLAHDLGKAWSGYQGRLSSKNPSFQGHEIVSSLPLLALYRISVLEAVDKAARRGLITACIAVLNHHHGMHGRFELECFYKPHLLLMELKKIARSYGVSVYTVLKEACRLMKLLTRLIKEECSEAYGLVSALECKVKETFMLQLISEGARSALEASVKSRELAAACIVASGLLSLADTVVASLERNEFSVEAVMKRYAGRVLNEKYGASRARLILERLVKEIARLYESGYS